MNANTKNNAPVSKKYLSIYGFTTAKDTAILMLDRSVERLRFLQVVFEEVCHRGDGFTMPGYSSEGLAAIMADIGYDVEMAHGYLNGDDPTPGKEFEGPEVRHD